MELRQDFKAWSGSMVFIFAIVGAIWVWGIAVGWDAPSGYQYFKVNSTRERFLPEPTGCNDTTIPGRSGTSCTSTWYFWKLKPDQVSLLTRAVVWLFYSLHQVFVWGLIYRAQLVKANGKQKGNQKYSSKLSIYNWSLLVVNGFFHIAHLVQSHWTYDATAQDVAIASSTGSVVMMLCFILLMEYKDRGFILMWPNSRSSDRIAYYLRLNPDPIRLLRKYHGIAFAWASVYTFWYHPMENTWAHALGFFHTAFVMLQGSLLYTKMHVNRYWRLLIEVWVLLHSTVVATQTSNPLGLNDSSTWPIFAFGFGFVFFFTQIFSFPFWHRISAWFRLIPVIIFFSIVFALSATLVETGDGGSGFSRIYLMTFIPAEEYAVFFFSWLFLYIFIVVERRIVNEKNPTSVVEGCETRQALFVSGVVIIYALLIMMSHVMRNLSATLFVSMVIYVIVFTFGICITIMFLKQIMKANKKKSVVTSLVVKNTGSDVPRQENVVSSISCSKTKNVAIDVRESIRHHPDDVVNEYHNRGFAKEELTSVDPPLTTIVAIEVQQKNS